MEQSSFRLGAPTLEKLNQLSRAAGVSQAAILRQLVAHASLNGPMERTRDRLIGAVHLLNLLRETPADAHLYQHMLSTVFRQLSQDFQELLREFEL